MTGVLAFLGGVFLSATAGIVVWQVKRLFESVDKTRPNLAIGFVDHDGSLALSVSNYNGGIGKCAECLVVDDGSHAHGRAKNDLILPGDSFDILTPVRHGIGPNVVVSARNAGQGVQYFWTVGKNHQSRRRRRRNPPLFMDSLTGAEELMRYAYVQNLGSWLGHCRFVRDRDEQPLVDR